MATKETTKTAAAKTKPAAPVEATATEEVKVKKPRAKKTAEEPELKTVNVAELAKVTIEKGKYIFAVGRRKTATATVRLFGGKGDSTANTKLAKLYFDYPQYLDKATKPLSATGTHNDVYFTAVVQGGGKNAQAEALRNAIAKALVEANPDFRPVLKKNGFLTRDDRKKERKKPGLKGARRRPQWAKR